MEEMDSFGYLTAEQSTYTVPDLVPSLSRSLMLSSSREPTNRKAKILGLMTAGVEGGDRLNR